MPSKRIDQLPLSGDVLKGSNLIPIFSDNRTERTTLDDIAEYISNNSDTFVTGVTYTQSASTLTLTRNDGVSLSTTIVSSGGGSFTGNTSGDCITDLYITNLHGCSPITVNDNLQYITSQALGNYSFAEGYQTTAGIKETDNVIITSAITIDWFYESGSGLYIPYFSGDCATQPLLSLTQSIEDTLVCLKNNGNSLTVNLTLYGGGEPPTTYISNYEEMPCDSKFVEGLKFFSDKGFTYTGGTGYTTLDLQLITVCETIGTNYCHSEGYQTKSIGASSHAEGSGTTASGYVSHAEGIGTIASGYASHTEGYRTIASGDFSHAEGVLTTASGTWSHAEGKETTASGNYSHTEGQFTIASGGRSHAEGYQTRATGIASHVEGQGNFAFGSASHAEGLQTTASNSYSHAEGWLTNCTGKAAHTEGKSTTASGFYSHAEGQGSIASGGISHAEGRSTASGPYSHSEGNQTTASNEASHSEGERTTASGRYSHAEGVSTTASGVGSHAEGGSTISSGEYSHSEGISTIASGRASHASGDRTTASGSTSFIHSYNSVVNGSRSVVLGGQNITGSKDDMVYVPNLNIVNIPSYADDAAAGVGGLLTGDVYQTSGAGASPLNVAGILMIKQ